MPRFIDTKHVLRHKIHGVIADIMYSEVFNKYYMFFGGRGVLTEYNMHTRKVARCSNRDEVIAIFLGGPRDDLRELNQHFKTDDMSIIGSTPGWHELFDAMLNFELSYPEADMIMERANPNRRTALFEFFMGLADKSIEECGGYLGPANSWLNRTEKVILDGETLNLAPVDKMIIGFSNVRVPDHF